MCIYKLELIHVPEHECLLCARQGLFTAMTKTVVIVHGGKKMDWRIVQNIKRALLFARVK